MTLLLVGLVIWIAAHLFKAAAPGARAGLTARLGAGPSKGVFAALIGLGLVLMILGYRAAPFTPVWTPPAWTVHLNNLMMLIAVGVFGMSMSKGRSRAWLRHPMLTAVVIWAAAHLLVNGDLASILLFGGLGLWAVANMAAINARDGAWVRPTPGPAKGDIRLAFITIAVFVVVTGVHAGLGVWPFPGVTRMLAYRFLTETDTAAFCHKVTAALARGWSLHGGPTYAFDAAAGAMRCGQAVVKEVDASYDPTMKLSETVMPAPATSKTHAGNFFEDYRIGQTIAHAVPRTVTEGDRSFYTALYPSRFALYSSDEFARSCGLPRSPLEDLAAFHIVFGKTVPDISLNAVANLGYAEARFLAPVYPGDTLTATSEVIGLKENSNRRSGVVWVRSTGRNQHGAAVLSYARWVMVRKRDEAAAVAETLIPDLAARVDPADLVVPPGLDFTAYDFALAGEPHRWGDYAIGEKIDHLDRMTVEEAEHMTITRLWQNTSKVHFDKTARPDGRLLVYGGHVISLARALSFNGLANVQAIVAINAGSHANPCFAGDTISAWSEVLDKAPSAVPGVGALRLRLVATHAGAHGFDLRGADGKYLPHVLLDLDYWALVPE